ncbi:MAG: CsbD family protein [Gemmatimonadota bacterium]
MDSNITKGNWKIFKGKVQSRWGKLTNDELDVAEGNREQLVGLVQKRYGEAKDAIEKELDDMERQSDEMNER